MASITQPQVHLWTRHEYHRLADLGFFAGRRVELIEGQVIDMAAMKSLHAVAVDLVDAALTPIFGQGYYIRQQKPFVVSDISEPEPDVAVVTGSIRDYTDAHPNQAALIVEVADASLTYDRTVKGNLYAKAGIADYWIVNLVDRQLQVYRYPRQDEHADDDWRYGEILTYQSEQTVAPLAAPAQFIAVADLLP